MKKLITMSAIILGVCFSAFAQVTVREILVDNRLLLRYTFSNNLNTIGDVVNRTAVVQVDLENAAWELSQNFPEVIKEIMTELDVNYATTPHMIPERMSVWGTRHTGTVYRRVGNQWFIYYYHKM